MKKSLKIALFSTMAVACVVIIGAVWYVFVSNSQVEERSPTDSPKSYTLSEVARHNTLEDCWTVINGSVYELTDFIKRHPGGDEISRACGIDASSLFNERKTADGQAVGSGTPHSPMAMQQLDTLKIGNLE